MYFKKRYIESYMIIFWIFNVYCFMFILVVYYIWVKDVYFEKLIGLEVKVYFWL